MRENFIITESKWESPEKGRKTSRDEGNRRKRGEKPWESIPSYFLLVLLGFLFLLGYLTSVIDDTLPAVVTDEEAGITRFSEERAWRSLREIVGSGPRVAGTLYHRTKTQELKLMLDRMAEEAVNSNVRTDWQVVSGDYWLGHARPFVNAYGNLSNIIAVLEGESGFNGDGTTNSSILLNCHYDTVPTSPGASDNALFCSTMVETLYLLSRRKEKLKHNIIFLFNGAEENPLQGASGFLKHPWSKGVTALVNLDSGGTNCKSLMFQVSDPRVVSAYSRSVSRPSAQALGEMLFASGIIPSDTDFRVFRDYGQIYGVDIAFSKVGHVYHTRHDSLDVILPGVIQHSGDMLYSLTQEMGLSEHFHTKVPPSTAVYWDYLNLFMLVYDLTAALIVDALVAAVGVASVLYYHSMVGFRWSLSLELLVSVLGRVLSAGVGVSLLWLVTAVSVATTIQLRYLSNSWLVVPMFWFPYLVGAVSMSQLFDAFRKSGLNRIRRMSQAMAATRLILVTVTIVLLCVPGTATIRYVVTLPLLLMSLASILSVTVIKRWRIKAYQQVVLECVVSLPAQLFLFMVAVKVNTLMLPIMGRSPTLKPDYLVAVLNMMMVVLCSIPLSGVELLFSRVRLWTVCLIAMVVCLSVSLAPIQPYSENSIRPVLQRHYWFHSEIITYDLNNVETDRRTGVWFAHTEVNTPGQVIEHAKAKGIKFDNIKNNFTEDCDKYTYCNLPMFTPRSTDFTMNSLWVPLGAPSTAFPAPLLSLRTRACIERVCTLDYTLIGPPHSSLAIWPRANVTLSSWSFESPVRETAALASRPVYFVYYSRATYTENVIPFEFQLIFTIPAEGTGPLVDIAFSSHRISHPEQFTSQYRALTEAMPDYYNIATFLSTRYNYVF